VYAHQVFGQLTNSREQSHSWKAMCHSANQKFSTFVEPESSPPCSQQYTIGPCPKPDISSPQLLTLIKTHFNIIFPSIVRSPMWSPSFRFSGLHFCIHFSCSAHSTLKIFGEAHYEIVTIVNIRTHRHNFHPTLNVKETPKVSIKVQIT